MCWPPTEVDICRPGVEGVVVDPVGDHLVNDGEASSGVAVAAPGPRHSPLSGQPVGTLLIYQSNPHRIAG